MVRENGVLVLGVAAGVLLGLSVAASRAERKQVPVLRSWDGILDDVKLLAAAPPGTAPDQGGVGVLTEEKAWAILWKAWRPNEKPARVDFTQELVLVFTLGGPNRISPPDLVLDDKGDLKAHAVATLLPGDGFCYKIAVIRRDGIKTIHGKGVK